MTPICLSFRVRDQLLKLLIPSFYPPKSIWRTLVPTIGSVRFLVLRSATSHRWVLHWVSCGILMIPLLSGPAPRFHVAQRYAYIVRRRSEWSTYRRIKHGGVFIDALEEIEKKDPQPKYLPMIVLKWRDCLKQCSLRIQMERFKEEIDMFKSGQEVSRTRFLPNVNQLR